MALALIGVPFDGNSSFERGSADAPARIRAQLFSDASNLWNERGDDLGRPGLLEDLGDVDCSGADPLCSIERTVTDACARDLTPIVLGGDHSISLACIRAAHAKHGALDVVQFDAHPDLYDRFQDNPYSHACPFARIMEEGLAARLVQVGIRTANGHQREQAERFGVETVEMRCWADGWGIRLERPVYLSVDLDVLDPAFAPGVSHPEPGGASVRRLIEAIHAIDGRIVGADVVECNPRRDPSGVSAVTSAKLVKEIAGAILSRDG